MRWLTILIISVLMLVPAVAGQQLTTTEPEVERDAPYTQEVLLNQDPDPVEPGEYVELRWRVTKLGHDTIENLSYRLSFDYPFSLDPGQEVVKNVGRWEGFSGENQYYTVYYKLRVAESATKENYEVELEKTYDGENWMSKTYDIRVDEAKEPNLVLGQMRTSPQELQSDMDETKVTIGVENIGDEGVENLKTKLKLPQGFSSSYSYSDEKVLGTINGGMGKPATYYLDIEEGLESGQYEAEMKLNYKEAGDDDNVYQQKTLPFNLTLKGKPDFNLADFSFDPEDIRAGNTVDLKMTIENTGEEEAESVSVHAFKDTSQPFEFEEKSDYVGTLEKGESGEAVVTFNVESGASAKKHMLDLEIRGVDDEEVIVEEKQVSLTINENNSRQPSPLTGVAIIGGIIVIGVAVFYFFRK